MNGPTPAARVAVAVYGAFAIAFAFVFVRTLVDPTAIAQTDFTAFYSGWWLVLHGRGAELYDVAAQTAAQHAIIGDHEFPTGLLAFLHPPPAALAGLPLGLVAERFGEPAAFRLWAVVNVALLVRLARGLVRLTAPPTTLGRALVVAALAGAFPVFLTLREGQVALLMAAAMLGLHDATRDGRAAASAAWLLVLSVKPQYLPLPLALLVALGRWRALALAAASGAVAVGVSAAVLGPDVFARYFGGLGALQAHLGHGVPGAMPTLRGLLVRLAGAQHVVGATTVAAVALALAALALALAGRSAARRAPLPLAFAATFAATLFGSPHLFVADLTMWAVPLALAASTLDAATPAGRAFRRFGLAWPVALGLTLALDAWPRLYFETATALGLVALVWIARLARRATPA